jgi:hypothetical protein
MDEDGRHVSLAEPAAARDDHLELGGLMEMRLDDRVGVLLDKVAGRALDLPRIVVVDEGRAEVAGPVRMPLPDSAFGGFAHRDGDHGGSSSRLGRFTGLATG